MKFKIAYRKKYQTQNNIKDFPNRKLEVIGEPIEWRDYIIILYLEK